MVKDVPRGEPGLIPPESTVEIPECNKIYSVDLGESFFTNSTKNYTFRYSFIPRSVENQAFGEVELGEKGVLVTHANEDYSSQTHFRGVKQSGKKEEFVLIFKDGKFQIEKLHVRVTNLKQTQATEKKKRSNHASISRTNQLRTSMFNHPPASRKAGVRGETKVLNPAITKKKRKPNVAKQRRPAVPKRNSKLPKRQREPPAPRLPPQRVPSRQDFERKQMNEMMQHRRQKEIHHQPTHQSQPPPVTRITARTQQQYPLDVSPTGPVGLDGRMETEPEYEDDDIQESLFGTDSEDE